MQRDLAARDMDVVKEGVKKVIAAMTVGTDVSMLFTDVLKRMQNFYVGLSAEEQTDVRTMLDASDMTSLLDMRLTREMGRANNLEVWL